MRSLFFVQAVAEPPIIYYGRFSERPYSSWENVSQAGIM